MQPRYRLTLITIIGTGARIGWALTSHAVPISDAAAYRAAALSLAAGQGYSIHGHPTAYWVPGWPAWLAFWYRIVGPTDMIIIAMNILLGALTIILVYLLARRYLSPRRASWAALLIAVWPAMVTLPRYLLSENLAIPGLLALLLLVHHVRDRGIPLRWALATGIAAGLLVLIREQNLAVVAGLGLFWLLARGTWRQRISRVGLFSAGACLILGLWVGRNVAVMHAPVLATSSGVNFWISFRPDATGGYMPVEDAADPTEIDANARFTAKALATIKADPARVLTLAPAKLAQFWLHAWNNYYWEVDAQGQRHIPLFMPLILTIIEPLAYLVILALAGVALATSPRRFALVACVLAAVSIEQAIMFGNNRFNAPFLPLLCILAVSIWSHRNSTRCVTHPTNTANDRDARATGAPPVAMKGGAAGT